MTVHAHAPTMGPVARAPVRDPGQLVAGKYRLEERVGEGGMGEVWAVTHVVTRRRLALKFLKASPRDEGARRRFLREARVSCAVEHPAVLPVMDVLELGGEIALVMELLAGESLAARLAREKRLGPCLAARLLLPIAEGLAAVHAAGVVHRDLKPSNIFLPEGGGARLLDFGIAAELAPAEGAGRTATGTAIGTPHYMSPEQAVGEKDLDHRTDVWSLGLVLYQCLSGTLPTEAESFGKVVQRLFTGEFPPLGPLAPSASSQLVGLVERMLRRDRGTRLADMAEVVRTLRSEAAASGTTTAPPASSGVAFVAGTPQAPRRRWLGAALAGIGLLGLTAVAVTGFFGGETPPAPAAPPPGASLARTAAYEDTAVRMIDLRPPRTSEAALTAYQGAMSAYRDGAYGRASQGMAAAVKADPGLAAGHLRLAIWTGVGDQAAGRTHYGEARRYREALSARDQALLAAFEPMYLVTPMNLPGVVERLRALSHARPRDAELAYLHGFFAAGTGQFEDAARSLGLAVTLDEGFAQATAVLGSSQNFLGASGRATLEACVRRFPEASECHATLVDLLTDEGDCGALEASGRATIRTGPNDASAYRTLARALVARQADEAAVREVLAQKERASHNQDNRLSSTDGLVLARFDELNLRILSGDLAGAAQTGAALWKALEQERGEAPRMAPARRILELHLERGALSDAAAFAADYDRKRSGWVHDHILDDWGMARDPRPLIFQAQRRGGTLSADAFASKHGAWLAQWEKDVLPGYRRWLWPLGYAAIAETREEAEQALAALARFSPIPTFRPSSYSDGDIGRVYYLARRPREALPWLERAARACWALDAPIAHTRAHYFLGLAREALGDAKGACDAYAVVHRRWGSARGRSVTGEATKKRRDALRCR